MKQPILMPAIKLTAIIGGMMAAAYAGCEWVEREQIIREQKERKEQER